MCFVHGCILGMFASSSAHKLSPNTMQFTVGLAEIVSSNLLQILLTSLMSGMSSCKLCKRLPYSDLVVDNLPLFAS